MPASCLMIGSGSWPCVCVCGCLYKKLAQRRCTLHWAPILKPGLSWRELWHYSLSPAIRGLSCSRAERSIYGPLLGFRGQKHIIKSDSAKLNNSSATERRWMSQHQHRWLSEFLRFSGNVRFCQNTVSLNRLICYVQKSRHQLERSNKRLRF